MSFRSTALAVLTATALTVAASASDSSMAATSPAATGTFGDWQADCGDEGVCVLFNRSAGSADGDGTGEDAVLALRRGPAPDASWQLFVAPLAPPADLTHPFALWVDGGPKLTFNPGYDFLAFGTPNNLFLVNSGLATRLLKMMMAGGNADFAWEPDGGGSARVRFALPGLDDGLRWIDGQQGRKQQGIAERERTVTAPTDLQPHPIMADVRSPIDGGTGQRGLPAYLLGQHYGVHGCEDLDSPLMAKTEPRDARLSDSAVLYVVPCTVSGKRIASRLYVVETGEIGGIETLTFARYAADYGWVGTDTLVNVEFDTDKGELISVSSDRDVDGCGHAAHWRWRGIRFALVEYRYRETCSGSANPAQWPVVFRLAE